VIYTSNVDQHQGGPDRCQFSTTGSTQYVSVEDANFGARGSTPNETVPARMTSGQTVRQVRGTLPGPLNCSDLTCYEGARSFVSGKAAGT